MPFVCRCIPSSFAASVIPNFAFRHGDRGGSRTRDSQINGHEYEIWTHISINGVLLIRIHEVCYSTIWVTRSYQYQWWVILPFLRTIPTGIWMREHTPLIFYCILWEVDASTSINCWYTSNGEEVFISLQLLKVIPLFYSTNYHPCFVS